MKIVLRDPEYRKENVDVRRSINMAIKRLEQRLSQYAVQENFNPEKIFADDVIVHDIFNKHFYVYKCKVNQMQIRLLWKVENNKLVIVAHWYKFRTDNGYIDHFQKMADLYFVR